MSSASVSDAIECGVCYLPMQGVVVMCSSCTQSLCIKCSGFGLTPSGDIDTSGKGDMMDTCPFCIKTNWQPLRNRTVENMVQKLMQVPTEAPKAAAVVTPTTTSAAAAEAMDVAKCPACKALLGDEEEQIFHMTEACPALQNSSKPCPKGCTQPAIFYSPHKLNLHSQNECPLQTCPCPLGADACGMQMSQRKLLQHHLDGHCDAKRVTCSAAIALNRLLPPGYGLRVPPGGQDTLKTSANTVIPSLLNELNLPRLEFSALKMINRQQAFASDPWLETEYFEAGCSPDTAYHTECKLHCFPGGEASSRDSRTGKMHVAYLASLRMFVLWYPLLGILRIRRCDSTCSDTRHAWRVSAVCTMGPWRLVHNVSFVPSLWVDFEVDPTAAASKKSGKESKVKIKVPLEMEALRVQVLDRPDAFAEDSKTPWCVRISLVFLAPGSKEATRSKYIAEQLTRMHQHCRSISAPPVAYFEFSQGVSALPALPSSSSSSSSSSGVKRARENGDAAGPAEKRIKLDDKIDVVDLSSA